MQNSNQTIYNELTNNSLLFDYGCEDPNEELLQEMILSESNELSEGFMTFLEETMIDG